MKKPHVLIVEDEGDISEILAYALSREGFEIHVCTDGTAGLSEARRHMPDLVLLDLMLPGLDGTEICRRLKSDDATKAMAVIMVSAKGEESDIVLGLGLGADDYIVKPFSPKELVARVKAVLRRVSGEGEMTHDSGKKIVLGDLVIDPSRHRVTVGDAEVPLTATEFRILHFLAAKPGRVFSRDQILTGALGPHSMALDRSIDVHIRSIRSKLGEHRSLVETVRGVGYRFTEQLPAT